MAELDMAMEQTRDTRDSDAALIITQNTESEIVGAEIISVFDAF